MKRGWLWACALGAALPAQAQESDFAVSAGLRLWNAHWSTFGYDTNADGNTVLTQNETKDRTVWLPSLSLRWGDFVGAVSGFSTSGFQFVDGGSAGKRREFDLNFGYRVLPALTLTVGYKKVEQIVLGNVYRPAGPIVGFSGSAPLGGPWSIYSALGIGRLKSPGGDVISFKADYRLAELGMAYNLPVQGFLRQWTFTAGYRMQSMSSKEALGSQSGNDDTNGLTLGVVATF
ncbi:MAG: hypothetical protein U1F50_17420 [Rubrivivax sp.]